MKIIDYVYKKEFSSPNWIGTGHQQFKDKDELINWIPTSYCPSRFVDFPFLRPNKKGTACIVENKSEKQQLKLCKECWNRDYFTNEDDDLLDRLKNSGKRLKELLNITEEDIDRAIKEIRKESL